MIVLQEKGNENSSFSDPEGYEQLVNVLMDLFIAGTDTTSLTLTFGVLFLTKYVKLHLKPVNQCQIYFSQHPKSSR